MTFRLMGKHRQIMCQQPR